MNLEAVIEEIKELAIECVQKQREECIKVSDSVVLAYLTSLLPEHDLDIIHRYQQLIIGIFRETAQEELEFLNNRP